ncbi:alpha/beta hydrolase [Thiohalophilus thiocyanatoxydans]|uniref:Phospholipase/carboxylesterase n=1 Tax=Thiohalophilus thiocyanatoxydans TaxID=381308 RepID=A0A4V3H4P2_9GAMM|nr:alpha/beta hydrolase [Thiohalophilus thiocyanatoxydans]TDY03905.1 phospholipase/carboxylesterase [Thiohalophilus thiocyanatoxydans]
MSQLPECVEVGPAEAQHCVIWLHGLGADGHDFEPLVPELGLVDRSVRFVFPHAPVQPVTLNGGMAMRAWYDIRSPRIQENEDTGGIRASQAMVEALIQQQHQRGIPSHRIILAGFSQGGAIALHTGLRQAEPLGGILALSAYLPLVSELDNERHPASQVTPIFMAHGSDDPVVPLSLAEHACHVLQQADYSVTWKVYPMQHQVHPAEIADIATWLRQQLDLGAEPSAP